jgi:hypothetical protein
VLVGGGVAATAGAAAAVIALMGGATPSAYALDKQADGSVTVHIRSLSDASGLQSSLREAGIPAVVNYDTSRASCTPPAGAVTSVQTGDDDGPSTRRVGDEPAAHGDVARMKASSAIRVTDDGVSFTIDPGTLKAGDKVFITTSTGEADSIGMAIGSSAPPRACPPPTP